MALIKRDYVCSHTKLRCLSSGEIKTSRHRQSAKTIAGARHQMAQCVHGLGFGIAADHKGP